MTYWGLRDYGTATWEGGDPECQHQVGRNHQGGLSEKQASNAGSFGDEAVLECPKCGARRIDNQLGLERTPEEYVANLVAVFREVRRVLRKDGTLWLNLGDSYAGGGRGRSDEGHAGVVQCTNAGSVSLERATVPCGLKPKDLVGIPWRVAFALQADGWWLRSDCIWHKPNPMPESVTDRPTKAHEYVFLFAKSASYYYDNVAASEPSIHAGLIVTHNAPKEITDPGYDGHRTRRGMHGRSIEVQPTRNRRSVWTIPTRPYSGAHFATFPEALVEPCILAGTKPGDLVLDPFGGAGTVGVVAKRLGRDAVLIDLNPVYVEELARPRIERTQPCLEGIGG